MVEATERRSDEATKGGQGWRAPHASRLKPDATPRAFTLTELLVVVAIVVVLLSILIVAVNAAARTAQRANTQFLMTSIGQGLVHFKQDIGYYPPVLDDGRKLRPLVDPSSGSYAADVQDWFSNTTLAEFLIGPGPGAQDGYGYPDAGETPPLGIRHPGRDGVWGATTYGAADGTLAARSPPLTGKVYSPYIELKDERLLGGLRPVPGGDPEIVFPGEDPAFDTYPKVIVDYWGKPIRYYRQPYPPGALHAVYRAGTIGPAPTLADVIILRPYSIKPGSESDNLAVPDTTGDTSIVMSMRTAEIGLVSAGPDRSLDVNDRVDTKELNKDNIVELGP